MKLTKIKVLEAELTVAKAYPSFELTGVRDDGDPSNVVRNALYFLGLKEVTMTPQQVHERLLLEVGCLSLDDLRTFMNAVVCHTSIMFALRKLERVILPILEKEEK